MGGRPRNFDADEVLDRALELFWKHGYASTSLSALLSHMGICRQSLYNTFGDKRHLFLAALDRYIKSIADPLLRELEKENASYPEILRFFGQLTQDEMQSIAKKGCMIGKSCMELGGDQAVDQRVLQFFSRTAAAFSNALKNAVDQGEIRPLNAEATAHHLTATFHGLGMMMRAGASPQTQKDVIQIALSVLEPIS